MPRSLTSSRILRRACLGVGLAGVVSGGPAGAASFVGDGADTNWNTPENWSPAIPAAGEEVTINDETALNTLTLNDAPHAIGLLSFGATGGRVNPFTINTANGNTLTFNAGLTNTQVATTGIFLTLALPVVVQGDQTWTIGGANAGTVTTDAGVNLSATSNSFTLNGRLTKEGPGQLLFIGRNIGNGNIDINAGAVKLNAGSSALLTVGGTGTITVKSGATLMISKNSGTLNMTKAVVVESGGTVSVGGNNVPATTPTVDSPISWNGTSNFNLTSNTANHALNFTGSWTGSGTINITSAGTGTNRFFVLSGDNSGLSAQFTNRVAMVIGSANALGTGIYRADSGSSLRSVDATARTIGNVVDLAASTTFGSAGTGDLIFTATTTTGSHTGISTGSAAKTLTILNDRTAITGTITSGVTANALTKAGPGILEFGGANTYDRPTTVNEGTLRVVPGGRLGAPANTRLITVADAGLLDLQAAGIADGAALSVSSTDPTAEVNIAAGVNDLLSALTINGVSLLPGTYGSSVSGAANAGLANPDEVFSGQGILTVLVPEPGSLALLGAAGAGLLGRRRRR